jgi:hypothetical protein
MVYLSKRKVKRDKYRSDATEMRLNLVLAIATKDLDCIAKEHQSKFARQCFSSFEMVLLGNHIFLSLTDDTKHSDCLFYQGS